MDENRGALLYIAKYKGWDFVCKEFHGKMSDPFLIEFMPYIDIDFIASKREVPKHIVDRFKSHKTKNLSKSYSIIKDQQEDPQTINKLINTYIGTIPDEMEFENFMNDVYMDIRESAIEFQKRQIQKYYASTSEHFNKKYLDDEEAMDISRVIMEIKEYVKSPGMSKGKVVSYLKKMVKDERIMFHNEVSDYSSKENPNMTYFTFYISPKGVMMNYFIVTYVKK